MGKLPCEVEQASIWRCSFVLCGDLKNRIDSSPVSMLDERTNDPNFFRITSVEINAAQCNEVCKPPLTPSPPPPAFIYESMVVKVFFGEPLLWK